MGRAVADLAVGGVSAGTFELFTLGTLAALALLRVVGYLTAKPPVTCCISKIDLVALFFAIYLS